MPAACVFKVSTNLYYIIVMCFLYKVQLWNFEFPPIEKSPKEVIQCGQIGRDCATLLKFKNALAIFSSFFSILLWQIFYTISQSLIFVNGQMLNK